MEQLLYAKPVIHRYTVNGTLVPVHAVPGGWLDLRES
jgi:hypothetical protein